ncbi:MAG: imidazole glycerol phosphate synthase subunit HisH [Candidatus Glassbacteria bacterium]|nr:imidazole glycerol phosphate synthase subunit HisH [Candidatus Glassbacteria bacterium]
MINIIDFKMGNLRSVEKAFHHLGFEARISQDPEDIAGASHLVLPGDGAFGKSMEHIDRMGFEQPLRNWIGSGRPFLGICVGFQLLFERSDEMGEHTGLGLFEGDVQKFPPGRKIPHMGWNQVSWRYRSPLVEGIADGAWFYFVHSYYARPSRQDDVLGVTDYDLEFAAVVGNDDQKTYAVQFHPEKSQEAGLKLLENFATMRA